MLKEARNECASRDMELRRKTNRSRSIEEVCGAPKIAWSTRAISIHKGFDSSALLPFSHNPQSHLEKQPIQSDRGLVLTWDGRLDNRDDLRAQLQQRSETTPTDADIVSHALDRWEFQCLSRFIGDWAISIWNPVARQLVLAAITWRSDTSFSTLPRMRCGGQQT